VTSKRLRLAGTVVVWGDCVYMQEEEEEEEEEVGDQD
jgi:hypothetical protein